MTSPQIRFFNRELSWLAFNDRVLAQTALATVPLLERARFLGIFNSNLDEFFMKRVGGLKRQVLAKVSSAADEAAAPAIQLAEIRRIVLDQIARRAKIVQDTIVPELQREGIGLLTWSELTADERLRAQAYFDRTVFPVLTPLTVDPGHPFPFISNLSTSFGVLLRNPADADATPEGEIFARIKVPSVFPAWLRVDAGAAEGDDSAPRFVSLLDLVGNNLSALFPGLEIVDATAFRITRNADVERDEEDAEDLLELIAQELRERRFAQVVRLEHGPRPNPRILKLLREELELAESDVYELPAYLEYCALGPPSELNRPKLRYPAWVPVTPPELSDPEVGIFEAIRSADLLVHHPFDSFSATVERFVRSAVDDPKVLAIKMTLYRTGEDSPFIPLLIRAAEAGKQVVCLVELKARFDEEKNILVAQALERAGVHVVYGLVGLKTHSKLTLVVRQEADAVRCYAHIATGNYHARTARQYTDLGLFTAKPEITDDVVHLFHHLTGRSLRWTFRRLLVAPIDMKRSFLRMIAREAQHAREGRPAGIVAKMNSLEDRDVCRALAEASGAGVPIDLIVRGVCCLPPGLSGVSENIRIVSVVGRFLEHSRIFHFRNGAEDPAQGEFYIGSADWMHRNLEDRVEAIVPIEDRALRQRLWEVLTLLREDRALGWEMRPDGTYVSRRDAGASENPGAETVGSQEMLMRLARERAAVRALR